MCMTPLAKEATSRMNPSDAYFIREFAYHLTSALQHAVYQLHSMTREEDMLLYKRYLIYALQQNGGELVVDRDAAEAIDPERVRIIREFSDDGKLKLKLGDLRIPPLARWVDGEEEE